MKEIKSVINKAKDMDKKEIAALGAKTAVTVGSVFTGVKMGKALKETGSNPFVYWGLGVLTTLSISSLGCRAINDVLEYVNNNDDDDDEDIHLYEDTDEYDEECCGNCTECAEATVEEYLKFMEDIAEQATSTVIEEEPEDLEASVSFTEVEIVSEKTSDNAEEEAKAEDSKVVVEEKTDDKEI